MSRRTKLVTIAATICLLSTLIPTSSAGAFFGVWGIIDPAMDGTRIRVDDNLYGKVTFWLTNNPKNPGEPLLYADDLDSMALVGGVITTFNKDVGSGWTWEDKVSVFAVEAMVPHDLSPSGLNYTAYSSMLFDSDDNIKQTPMTRLFETPRAHLFDFGSTPQHISINWTAFPTESNPTGIILYYAIFRSADGGPYEWIGNSTAHSDGADMDYEDTTIQFDVNYSYQLAPVAQGIDYTQSTDSVFESTLRSWSYWGQAVELPAIPPKVTSSTPVQDGEFVSASADISLTFNIPLDLSTVTTSSVHLDCSGNQVLTIGFPSAQAVLIEPQSTLPFGTICNLVLDSTIMNLEGRHLDGNGDEVEGDSYYLNFTTEPAANQTIEPNMILDLASESNTVSNNGEVMLTWTAPQENWNDPTSSRPAASYEVRYATTGPIDDDTAWNSATAFPNSLIPMAPGQQESLIVTGLTDLEHWFAIRSTDDYGNFNGSNSAGPTIPKDTIAPCLPQNFAVDTNPIGNSINITWDACPDTDIVRYDIERADSPPMFVQVGQILAGDNEHAGRVYFIDSGLVDGQNYYYQVRSCDEAPNCSPWTPYIFGTPEDIAAPAQPQNLVAHAFSNSPITDIIWDPVTTHVSQYENEPMNDLNGYDLWRSSGDESNYALLDTVEPGITSYYDDTTVPDTTYFYKVQAYDDGVPPNYSPFSTSMSVLTPAVPLIENLQVDAVPQETSMTISWTHVEQAIWDDIQIYNLSRREDGTLTWEDILLPYSGVSIVEGRVVFIDTNLASGAKYWYKLHFLDGLNNISPTPMAIQNTTDDVLGPKPPVNLTVSDTEKGNTLYLVWERPTENEDGSPLDIALPRDVAGYSIFRSPNPTAGEFVLIVNVSASSTSYLDPSVIDLTTYYYKVVAFDNSLTNNPSNDSNIASGFSTDQMPPPSIDQLSTEVIPTGNSLYVMWSDINIDPQRAYYQQDVSVYELHYRASGDDWQVLVNQTTAKFDHIGIQIRYRVDGLDDLQDYEFRVRAADERFQYNGFMSTSGTPVDTIGPGIVTDIMINDTQEGREVLITWQAPEYNAAPHDNILLDDLMFYRIYWSNSEDPYAINPTQFIVVAGTDSSYMHTHLTDGQKYYYQLLAYDEGSNPSPISIETNSTPTNINPPPSPTQFRGNSTGDGTAITLGWVGIDISDMYGFNVYRKTSPTALYGQPINDVILGADQTAYIDADVNEGTTYYYIVKSVDTKLALSQASNAIIVSALDTILPFAPSGLLAMDPVESSTLNISWNSVPDATSYEVYRTTSSGAGYMLIGEVLASRTYFVDNQVIDGLKYYYAIQTLDTATTPNRSPYSTEINFTLVNPLPRLTYVDVGPKKGLMGDSYNFTVIYSDADADQNPLLTVLLDGLNFTLYPGAWLTVDGTLVTGRRYYRVLQGVDIENGPTHLGSHSYSITAYDGSNWIITDEYSFYVNAKPTLSDVNVNPSRGGTDTLFKIKVVYTDADKHPPNFILCHIDGDEIGVNLERDLSTSNPILSDNDYSNGEAFFFTTTLTGGSHSFWLEANDGYETVRYPGIGFGYYPNVTMGDTTDDPIIWDILLKWGEPFGLDMLTTGAITILIILILALLIILAVGMRRRVRISERPVIVQQQTLISTMPATTAMMPPPRTPTVPIAPVKPPAPAHQRPSEPKEGSDKTMAKCPGCSHLNAVMTKTRPYEFNCENCGAELRLS